MKYLSKQGHLQLWFHPGQECSVHNCKIACYLNSSCALYYRVLRGDRPYWWVHESAKWQNVTIQQYELTCETGPGKELTIKN